MMERQSDICQILSYTVETFQSENKVEGQLT